MGAGFQVPAQDPHAVWAGEDDYHGPTKTVSLLLRSGHTVKVNVRGEYADQWDEKIRVAMAELPGTPGTRGFIRLPMGVVAMADVVGLIVSAEDGQE